MNNEQVLSEYFAGPVTVTIEHDRLALVDTGTGHVGQLEDYPEIVQEALLLQWLQAYREFHDQLDREIDLQRRGIPVIRGVLGRGGGQW